MNEREEFDKESEKRPGLIRSFETVATVTPGNWDGKETSRLLFKNKEGGVEIEIHFPKDQKEIVEIVHMIHLGKSKPGKGHGRVALETFIDLAKKNGITEIIASVVLPEAEEFWEKCGFVFDEHSSRGSERNYVYQGRSSKDAV